MLFLLDLAWRDLRSGGRGLWVFVASLVLGVMLVAAGGGLYQQVTDALRADIRLLFGGDVEIQTRQPLPQDPLNWVKARGEVSQVVELRTMLMTGEGRSQLVELFSVDEAYPLYGELVLQPAGTPQALLDLRDGQWGAAVDATLAKRLGLSLGENILIGELSLKVRAIVIRQPDRSLRADWGAAPVLIARQALMETGLIQPSSRVDYLYRVKLTDGAPAAASQFRDDLVRAFPGIEAEVRSFDERSERMTEVLGQIGSGLLLVGFSALFIGGLGVFNSIKAHLDGKLISLATLRALGLRERSVALFVILQVLMLAALSCAVGVLLGGLLAVAGATVVADQLPVDVLLSSLWQPSLIAWLFGVLTALVFALPAVGRALSVSPAALFRGMDGQVLHTSMRSRQLTALASALVLLLLALVLPDSRLGLVFVVTLGVLLAALGLVTKLVRAVAHRLQRMFSLSLSLQMALGGIQQPQSPMRVALVSLGSALTLIVACALVVMTLLRTVHETVPASAPAMVFYDIQTAQIPLLTKTLQTAPGLREIRTAPFVLGRLVGVNGQSLQQSDDIERLRESHDEHKLSDSRGNFDDVVVQRGAWWPSGYRGAPQVAMEDREAHQLGLNIGDRLRFEILGQTLEAELVAIYAQRRVQARLWLEAIFSDGVLDPFVTRHVGAAWLPADQAIDMQDQLAALAPNIATARTESILRESKTLLGRASLGLSVIGLVCLAASLLVLASVVVASRSRQLYQATIMHVLGARHSLLAKMLVWEYVLIACVTAVFAIVLGSLLATALLQWRLDLTPMGLYWTGALTAALVSFISLGTGACYLLSQMRLSPAILLRTP